MLSLLACKLDLWLYRRPFEGGRARRYTSIHRRGFGDLDRRLICSWDRELGAARTVLDLGSGPGSFARCLTAVHPHLTVIALEPSAALAGARPVRHGVRARAEALPIADSVIDVAVCLSSIRHVHDRHHALYELRRVVASAGAAYIVELDPSSDHRRIRNHSSATRSWLNRLTFGPLLVKTAPRPETIAAIARCAGWTRIAVHTDPLQPLYIMRLSQ
ncbi:MAG: class I SAM-dependent methyltransferase [Proteobacteria bacterium]|nr:class I SAM-dependent methyltransferase [Pseudomonadota bacterium]